MKHCQSHCFINVEESLQWPAVSQETLEHQPEIIYLMNIHSSLTPYTCRLMPLIVSADEPTAVLLQTLSLQCLYFYIGSSY